MGNFQTKDYEKFGLPDVSKEKEMMKKLQEFLGNCSIECLLCMPMLQSLAVTAYLKKDMVLITTTYAQYISTLKMMMGNDLDEEMTKQLDAKGREAKFDTISIFLDQEKKCVKMWAKDYTGESVVIESEDESADSDSDNEDPSMGMVQAFVQLAPTFLTMLPSFQGQFCEFAQRGPNLVLPGSQLKKKSQTPIKYLEVSRSGDEKEGKDFIVATIRFPDEYGMLARLPMYMSKFSKLGKDFSVNIPEKGVKIMPMEGGGDESEEDEDDLEGLSSTLKKLVKLLKLMEKEKDLTSIESIGKHFGEGKLDEKKMYDFSHGESDFVAGWHMVAMFAHVDFIKYCVEELKVDVNQQLEVRGKKAGNVLHLMMTKKAKAMRAKIDPLKEMVEYLISKGVDLKMKNDKGEEVDLERIYTIDPDDSDSD